MRVDAGHAISEDGSKINSIRTGDHEIILFNNRLEVVNKGTNTGWSFPLEYLILLKNEKLKEGTKEEKTERKRRGKNKPGGLLAKIARKAVGDTGVLLIDWAAAQNSSMSYARNLISRYNGYSANPAIEIRTASKVLWITNVAANLLTTFNKEQRERNKEVKRKQVERMREIRMKGRKEVH